MTPPLGENRWIPLSEKLLFLTPVMSFVEQECRSSEREQSHLFYILRSKDWCNVIPVTADGKVVMVRQFRIGIAEHTLEIPGGMIDSEDGEPRTAALRELAEETGFLPLPDARVLDLGWVHPNPAILDNKTYLFAVGPVSRQRELNLDAGEMIEVVEVALEEIPRLIQEQKITHDLTIASLFRLTLATAEGSDGLKRGLKNLSRA